jgi:hypothetical protein
MSSLPMGMKAMSHGLCDKQDSAIVTALRSQLSWIHLREIIALDDPLKRQFYTELCRRER